MTDAEASESSARPWDTRKRCSDLRRDGLIERVGTTTDHDTGEAVMVCGLTDEGRAAARSLSAGATS